MAKESGLNVRLYVNGYDLSGDANALDGLGYTQELFDTTTLSQSTVSRIAGRTDGSCSVSAYFDAASAHIHAVMTANSGAIPTTNQNVLIPLGGSVGSDATGFIAKEGDYAVSGAIGSPVTVSATYSVDGVEPAMATMVTAHDDAVTSSTSGTAVDDSASSSDGGSWFYQILSFSAVGGNARWHINLQHSSDNSTYTDVSSATVTGIGAARTEFTGTFNRYVKNRVVMDASSGALTFAIGYIRG